MKSWKTSLIGLILIGVGVYVFITTKDFTQPAICVTMGTGLFFAKDSNVTGGAKQV
jgi:hypothetical protein